MFAAPSVGRAPGSALMAIPARRARGPGRRRFAAPRRLNVRERPSLDSPVILSLQRGRVVTVEKLVGRLGPGQVRQRAQGLCEPCIWRCRRESRSAASGTPRHPRRRRTRRPLSARRPRAPSLPGTPASQRRRAARPTAWRSELAELRERLAALESAVVATPALPSGAAGRAIRRAHRGRPPRPGGREPTRAGGALLPAAQLPDPRGHGPIAGARRRWAGDRLPARRCIWTAAGTQTALAGTLLSDRCLRYGQCLPFEQGKAVIRQNAQRMVVRLR